MTSALGLIPTASGVLVDIPVCRRILVAIGCLARSRTIAVLARRSGTFTARRSLYYSHSPLRGGLMRGESSIAVLWDDRAAVAAVGVGGLMRRSIGTRVRVV